MPFVRPVKPAPMSETLGWRLCGSGISPVAHQVAWHLHDYAPGCLSGSPIDIDWLSESLRLPEVMIERAVVELREAGIVA